jgi:hypothetical protein
MDSNLTYLESIAGGVIPSNPTVYFPDVETLFDDIFYILDNDPVPPDDPVWENFLTPVVINLADFDPSAPALFLNKGIYEEVTNVDGDAGTTEFIVGYSGVTNIGAIEPPDDYSPAIYYLNRSIDTLTEDLLSITLSVKTDIEIGYDWANLGGDNFETQIYFQNLPNFNQAISVNVIVDNSGATATGTYNIEVFGSGN